MRPVQRAHDTKPHMLCLEGRGEREAALRLNKTVGIVGAQAPQSPDLTPTSLVMLSAGGRRAVGDSSAGVEAPLPSSGCQEQNSSTLHHAGFVDFLLKLCNVRRLGPCLRKKYRIYPIHSGGQAVR